MKFFLLSCLCAMVIMMCQAQSLSDPVLLHNRRLNLRRLNSNLDMPDNLYVQNNRRTFPLVGYGGLGGMVGGGIGGGINGGISAGIDAGIGAGAYGYGGLGGGVYGGNPYYG